MVNRSPSRANGPMRGRNTPSYQARPRARSPYRRVRYPATSGTPRKTTTDHAMAATENCTLVVAKPSQPGSTCR